MRGAGKAGCLGKPRAAACGPSGHHPVIGIQSVGAGSVCPHLRGAPPRQADACLRPRTTNLRTDRAGDACAEEIRASLVVIPAKAGIQLAFTQGKKKWIPAFAGMTAGGIAGMLAIGPGAWIYSGQQWAKAGMTTGNE